MALKAENTVVELMEAKRVRGRWAVLSLAEQATLSQAEEQGRKLKALVAYLPFGTYLMALELAPAEKSDEQEAESWRELGWN